MPKPKQFMPGPGGHRNPNAVNTQALKARVRARVQGRVHDVDPNFDSGGFGTNPITAMGKRGRTRALPKGGTMTTGGLGGTASWRTGPAMISTPEPQIPANTIKRG